MAYTAAQAITYYNYYHISVAVLDSAANVSAKLDGLQTIAAANKLISITLTASGGSTMTIKAAQLTSDAGALGKIVSPYNLALTAATAATATSLATKPHVISVAITDSAANVDAALDTLQGLATASKLGAITLTGTGTQLLTVTAGQLTADAGALGKIASAFSLAVTGATAANATSLAGQAHVKTVSVTDSAAHVDTSLDALQALASQGKLGTVALTDGGTPTMAITAAQLTADAGAIGDITSPFALSVSGVAAAKATSVGATAHVTSLTVSDTAAQVGANLDALQALAAKHELTAINVTDHGTITITAAQQTADATALAEIPQGSYTLVIATAPPSPPYVATSFQGISSTGINAGWVPPDNALAVGPANVVTVENSAIEFSSLTGTVQTLKTLTSFFAPLGNFSSIYDPHAFYDSVNGRFVVVADQSNSSMTQSSLLVAVSVDSNPADGWHYQSINASKVINGATTWADYPMVAVDGQNIYISTNQFNSSGAQDFAGNITYTLNDFAGSGGGLYNGGTSTVTSITGYGAANNAFSYQVAAGAGVGAFYVSYLGDALSVQAYNSNTHSYGAWNTVNLGNIDIGSGNYTVAEKGSSTPIDAGDARVSSATYANGFLYGVMEVVPPGSSLPDVHWFKLDVSHPDAVTLVAQGDIPGSAIGANVTTFNPSIAVDGNGDVLINFTASGPNMEPSDYYAVHLATDPTSAFSTPALYQASSIPYTYDLASYGGGTSFRWGDYSTAIADPAHPGAFWISNEFAGSNQTWSTVVANVVIPGSVPGAGSTGAPSNGTASASAALTVASKSALATDAFALDPDFAGVANGHTVSGSLADTGHAHVSLDVIDVTNAAGVSESVSAGHPAVIEGAYGTLTLAADGSFSYAADPDPIASGGIEQDTFQFAAVNAHGAAALSTLTVTIHDPGESYLSSAGHGPVVYGGPTPAVLDGGAGHALLMAGSAPDTLIGGPADTLFASHTAQDTFVFAPHFGNETVIGFKPATDILEFNHQDFANVQAILDAAAAVPGTHDTIITHFDPVNTSTESITLKNVSVASLHADHFLLV